MTSVAATLEWLDARTPAPPPELRSRMADALAPAQTLPGALAEAALSCLQAALARGGDRAAALDLLAADALLTYAMEAAAEAGAEALAAAADAYGSARLAALRPESQK
ncbi:MAG TPA: hypothetical protein VFQ38_17765 [Longimicrobiales bacterium]|nr:hypothetical protein [Longimicrobiales bacterium]